MSILGIILIAAVGLGIIFALAFGPASDDVLERRRQSRSYDGSDDE